MSGVVAQLGARYHGTVEVVGSNPIDSTICKRSRALVLLPLFLLLSSILIGLEIFFDRDIMPVALDLINSAERSVELVSFGVTHPDVVDALKRAQLRGVDVTIVTDSESSCPLPHVVDTSSALMHEKFLIVDAKTVLAGTMNFTISGMESDQNIALLIEKSEFPEVVVGFLEEFSNLQNGRFQQLKSPVKANSGRLKLVFSPQFDYLRWVVPILADARREVVVAAYAFTDPQLTAILKYLDSDNVDVKVLLDEKWNQNSSSSELRYLPGGVELRLYPAKSHMHAKIMIVDRKWLLLGSANFTLSARFKNDEFVLVVDSPEIVEKAREWFFYLWEMAR
mgnify:CR=1 FL=1